MPLLLFVLKVSKKTSYQLALIFLLEIWHFLQSLQKFFHFPLKVPFREFSRIIRLSKKVWEWNSAFCSSFLFNEFFKWLDTVAQIYYSCRSRNRERRKVLAGAHWISDWMSWLVLQKNALLQLTSLLALTIAMRHRPEIPVNASYSGEEHQNLYIGCMHYKYSRRQILWL